jgi:hypothetical protein
MKARLSLRAIKFLHPMQILNFFITLTPSGQLHKVIPT